MVKLANKERILELLYKNRKPMKSREIAIRLELPYESMTRYIQRIKGFIVSKKENGVYTYYIPRHRLGSVHNRLKYLYNREGGMFEEDEIGLDTDTE